MTTHGLYITYILNPDSMSEKELSEHSNSDLYDLLVYLLYTGLTLEKTLAGKKNDDTQRSVNEIKKLETIRFLAFKLMAYFKFDIDTFLVSVPSMHQDFFMTDILNLLMDEKINMGACRTFITLFYHRWVLKFNLKSMYPGKQNFKNSNNVNIAQSMQDVYFVANEVHETVVQKVAQTRDSTVAELEQCLKECDENKSGNIAMPNLECFVLDTDGSQQICFDRATPLNRDTFLDMVFYETGNFFFIVEDYSRAYHHFCKVKNLNQAYSFLDSFRSISQSMISGKVPRDVDSKDGEGIEKKTQSYLSSIIVEDENVFNFDPRRSSDLKKIVQVLKNAASTYKTGEELYRFNRLAKYLIFRVNGLYESLDSAAKVLLLEKHSETNDDSEMMFEEGEINVEEELLHDDDSELTLLEATDPMVIRSLIPSITKHPMSLNSRWALPTYHMNIICQMPQSNFYKCYVILAKAQELRNAGFLNESRTLYLSLFEDIQTSNNALAKVIGNEILHIDLKVFFSSGSKDQDERRLQDLRIKCSEFLQSLDMNDYMCYELVELVCFFQFKHAQYMRNDVNMRLSNSPIALIRFYSWLAFLTHADHNSGREIYGKEVFEACLSMFVSPNSKYPTTLTKINFCDSLPTFVSKLQNNKTTCLVATCLMKIYNAIKDNPSQMVAIAAQFDFFPASLPPNFVNTIEVRSMGLIVDEALRTLLAAFPNEKHLTRYYAEFLLAEGLYANAMRQFLRLMILKTEYFVNFKQNIDSNEALVQQMIACCTKLGHHVQAALLYQLSREPDYGHAFKELTQSNFLDSSDDLYECIWDNTLLEYLIHLHTRRGDDERLQKVLRLIAQLDLNSNNSASVLQEAANLRKSRLFRMLCKQYM